MSPFPFPFCWWQIRNYFLYQTVNSRDLLGSWKCTKVGRSSKWHSLGHAATAQTPEREVVAKDYDWWPVTAVLVPIVNCTTNQSHDYSIGMVNSHMRYVVRSHVGLHIPNTEITSLIACTHNAICNQDEKTCNSCMYNCTTVHELAWILSVPVCKREGILQLVRYNGTWNV